MGRTTRIGFSTLAMIIGLALVLAALSTGSAQGQDDPDSTPTPAVTPGPDATADATDGDDVTPTSGSWVGTALYGQGEAANEAEMYFDIDAEGNITAGYIKLVFTFEGISESLMQTMQEDGCHIVFEAIATDSEPVTGSFDAPDSASGTFEATACSLKYYGDIEFAGPVAGTWEAALEEEAATEEADAAESADAADSSDSVSTEKTTGTEGASTDSEFSAEQLAASMAYYQDNCAECHGVNAEGTNLAPELNNKRIQRLLYDNLAEIIIYGVDQTEMEGYGSSMTDEETSVMIHLLKNWDALAPGLMGE
ncbi:MAG: cytochrome c [Chloroflexi bacterium]|nr:cytochrome c [Chloroflexota bacterium]